MMSHAYYRLFYHFVWSTWDREPLLIGEIERHAYALIRHQCQEANCILATLGGIENHVHLLVTLPRTLSIAEFMKSVKGVSARRLNEAHGTAKWAFKWQSGYGVHTVSPVHVRVVKRYIENQKEHHSFGKLWPSCELPDDFPHVREGGQSAL